MLRTARDNNASAILYSMLPAIDYHSPLPLFETEELVNIIMCFHANIFHRLKAHQYQLTIFSCIEHSAEIHVLFCFFFDICYKPFFHCRMGTGFFVFGYLLNRDTCTSEGFRCSDLCIMRTGFMGSVFCIM